MKRIRNSQLALRRECGWAYKRAYVDMEPGVPSPSLTAGRNVHAAVAEAIRALLRDGMVDVHRVAYRTVQGGDVEYSDALEVITRIQESLGVEWDIDPEGVILIEELLEMPVGLSSGEIVTLFGTPDLGERASRKVCRITDFKTHWHPESEHEFRVGQQLKRYALLVSEHYPGFEEFELVKRFVRYRNNFYTETLTREDLYQVRQLLVAEIEELVAYEARGEYEATPGSWCGLCREHATCPVILRFREQGTDDLSIEDDERARELAGAAVAMDEASAAIKGRLKRYLGAEHDTGRVDLAGGSYGYHPTERRELLAAELKRVLEEHGIEPPDTLWRTDLDVLDRMTRRLPDDVVRAVDGVTRRWQSTQCRFRKHTTKAPAPTKPNEPEPTREVFAA